LLTCATAKAATATALEAAVAAKVRATAFAAADVVPAAYSASA